MQCSIGVYNRDILAYYLESFEEVKDLLHWSLTHLGVGYFYLYFLLYYIS